MIKLAVATPMYGGQCHGSYAHSVGVLERAVRLAGGIFGTFSLGNESLIPRARNLLVSTFLNRTDADSLLFCDADQDFRAEDVMAMIEADKPVIAGPVPMKVIDWKSIGEAARRGVPDELLHIYGGLFNVEHFATTEEARSIHAPFRVKRIGCAFILIQRHVFHNLADVLPSYEHDLPDNTVPPGTKITEFFPVGIDEGRLMSEDYGFLNAWRGMGGEVWLAPWAQVTHWGTYPFTGSYAATHGVKASG